MGDDSSRSIVKSLKNEWSLFLEAFQSDEDSSQIKAKSSFLSDKIKLLNLEQIREMTKVLLEDRKRLNQRLESISKELDLNSAKLDSLRLVGASDEDTLKRIHELHDIGQNLSDALESLDKQLRAIREHENKINEEMLTP